MVHSHWMKSSLNQMRSRVRPSSSHLKVSIRQESILWPRTFLQNSLTNPNLLMGKPHLAAHVHALNTSRAMKYNINPSRKGLIPKKNIMHLLWSKLHPKFWRKERRRVWKKVTKRKRKTNTAVSDMQDTGSMRRKGRVIASGRRGKRGKSE